MVGLVAADLVLRVSLAGPPGVPLVLEVAGVHLDDRAGDVACLGVPGHVVSDREFRAHRGPPAGLVCAPPLCPASRGRAGSAMVPGSVRRLTRRDRKSTRLNSSHVAISYADFCLKKNELATELNSI